MNQFEKQSTEGVIQPQREEENTVEESFQELEPNEGEESRILEEKLNNAITTLRDYIDAYPEVEDFDEATQQQIGERTYRIHNNASGGGVINIIEPNFELELQFGDDRNVVWLFNVNKEPGSNAIAWFDDPMLAGSENEMALLDTLETVMDDLLTIEVAEKE